MRFLLDESADIRLARHLSLLGHDVTTISADYATGMTDQDVLSQATREARVLITNDSDFGELVFGQQHAHTGVILLRLGPYAELQTQTSRLDGGLERLEERPASFVVVTNHRVRVR